jgi:late competence protein required for DNA uptake (superfamily II DNA/RNA helicase)
MGYFKEITRTFFSPSKPRIVLRCNRCHSTRIERKGEYPISNYRQRRLYRCLNCGQRGYRDFRC